MKITFRINYHTQWGEQLFITGSSKTLGEWNTDEAFPMYHNGNGEWDTTIETTSSSGFEYKYIIKKVHCTPIWEGGSNRIFNSKSKISEVRDYWHLQVDSNSVLFTKVFTDALMSHPKEKVQTSKRTKTQIQFNIKTTRVPKGKWMGIIGNTQELGNWETPCLMNSTEYPIWSYTINLSKAQFPIEYKYVIVDSKTNEIDYWEEGNERSIFYLKPKEKDYTYFRNDDNFRYPTKAWKGAGIAVPVFSLRSEDSFGVGEFSDMKKLIDWATETGLKMIQLLPINETIATHSWLDSYPYKAISVYALHPIYLNLEKIGILKDEMLRDEFELAKEMLNSYPYVNYIEVEETKAKYYKHIFDQEWENVKNTKEYIDFFDQNQEWLEPYAAFCCLRDRFKTGDFREWGIWAEYDYDKIKKLVNSKTTFHKHVAIHYFIQYHLDKQLKEIVEYAHQKGVALKGDIPIGISPNSVEAWTLPKLFNLNGQAGAPPDDFAVLGQNWGFPTYNWDIMAEDNFSWWKKRLQTMSKYFDAYRIDHILGFFRIWEIPQDAMHGLLGYFKPGLPLMVDEILNAGIDFDYNRFVKPYIRGHFLHEIFGEHANDVRKLYLNEIEYNIFELKEEYDTQKKIYKRFTPTDEFNQKLSEKNVVIRDGLISLLDEVLFIKDPYLSYTAYHPRISMHYTYSYRELDNETKYNLDKLYIDFFYKRHEEFWGNEAMKKLPAIISASNMLVCGEDLGMVPDNVPEVMNELNILSLEIQRMPKNPQIEFSHPKDAPYMSVCTTSTHDMSTIRGWWEENRGKTQRFYHNLLGHNDIAPYFAEPWVCREMINQHLYSPAMWTIFPIQDLLAMDGDLRWDQTDKERINVPSDEKNKWRYRMVLSLEEMLNASEFNAMIKEMIHRSGRNSDL